MSGAPGDGTVRSARSGGRHDAARRAEVLDVALRHLAQQGSYAATTTTAIARDARTSKQSLQQWFGGKSGLFAEAIHREADRLAADTKAAIESSDPAATGAALRRFGVALLTRLLGEESVAINRAAIAEATTNPQLARLLHEHGRQATATVMVTFLQEESDRGLLKVPDANAAYEVLLGLVLSDWHTSRLLGTREAPSARAIAARVETGVQQFLVLFGNVARP